MVACNKCEKLTAHPPDFIRKRLEREIEATRVADAGAPPPLGITPAQKRANAIAVKKRARARGFGQRPGRRSRSRPSPSFAARRPSSSTARRRRSSKPSPSATLSFDSESRRHVARDDTLSRGSIPSLTLLIHRSRRSATPVPRLGRASSRPRPRHVTHCLPIPSNHNSPMSPPPLDHHDVSRRLRGTRRLERCSPPPRRTPSPRAPRASTRTPFLRRCVPSSRATARFARARGDAREGTWRSPRFSRRDGGARRRRAWRRARRRYERV